MVNSNEEVTYDVNLKFVKGESALNSELTKRTEETHKVSIDASLPDISFNLIMSKLDKQTQAKLRGKLISYWNVNYANFVLIGCTSQVAGDVPKDRVLFDASKAGFMDAARGPSIPISAIVTVGPI